MVVRADDGGSNDAPVTLYGSCLCARLRASEIPESDVTVCITGDQPVIVRAHRRERLPTRESAEHDGGRGRVFGGQVPQPSRVAARQHSPWHTISGRYGDLLGAESAFLFASGMAGQKRGGVAVIISAFSSVAYSLWYWISGGFTRGDGFGEILVAVFVSQAGIDCWM